VAHSWCWECCRERGRTEHHKDKERRNARSTEWQKANREKSHKATQEWKQRNHWRTTSEQNAQYARLRRARKHAAGGTHTLADIEAIFEMQRGRCAYCRKRLRSKRHVDHIIPISKGGSNGRRNLQLTCAHCNQTKSNRDPIAHAKELGRLI